MRFFILLFLSFLISSFALSEPAAKIVKLEGKVLLYPNGQVKPVAANIDALPMQLNAGDKIRVKRNASAVVLLPDASVVLLTEKSTLILKSSYNHFIETGKILYDIKKQKSIGGLIVATKSAIIGVKGTQFMVKENKGANAIFLQEGEITVESTKAEFKRAVQQEQDEFAQFKNEFNDYKKQMQEEFVEYVKSITLKEGKAINISGDNTVSDVKFTQSDKDDFALLNSLSY